MLSVRRAPAVLPRLGRVVLAAALAAGTVWSGAAIHAAPAGAVEPNFPSYDSGYHNLPEMVAEIQQAAVDYPNLVQISSIGKSYQGRDIWIAKVSNDVAVDHGYPEVLIDALHHAREHLSTEQALAVLRWLTTGYGHDAAVTSLMNSRVVWIIFALNPDGFRYDLTGTPFRGWRKNRQPTAGTNAIGTDLNRNYAYRFGCCGGSSGNPSSIIYRGASSFSAPETRALRDFVASRVIGGVQRIKTHVTLHTNGKLILWPYGYTKTAVPSDMTLLDHNALAAMGRGMAALNGYKAEQSSALYVTDGDEIDWLYGRYRIFSYTFELYPAETGTVLGDFYPDDSHIGPETARNRSALLRLIDRAGCVYADLGSTYARADCGPMYDDFEINRGWVRNSQGTDTATGGLWQIGVPHATADAGGAKQVGKAVSGRSVLATGLAAGTNANANDVDGGRTTATSAAVTLPATPGLLTFRYSFAHDAKSSTADSFQVLVQTADGQRVPVFTIRGRASNLNAAWATGSAVLTPWAGQTIRIVVAATDGGAASLVEVAVDDMRIIR
ncbi:MAG TPA: M14 family metallopeptidase [Candidatus Limnocylindrales bacterium]